MQKVMPIICEYPDCENRASYRCLGCKRLICFPCYAEGCDYHSKGTAQYEPKRGALSRPVDRPHLQVPGKSNPTDRRLR